MIVRRWRPYVASPKFEFRTLERRLLIGKTRRLPCGFWVTRLGWPTSKSYPHKEADPWNLPPLSSTCYSPRLDLHGPPTQTFLAIVAGWVLSLRHRFITEVIFSSGNVGNGHWSRFHRFFSHAAWDIDTFSLALTKLVLTILAPGALLIVTVDDTLCRKRGLTLYGVGMHYDPLISSRSKKLVSWGHDWVVLCVLIVHPFWAPTKVFALPIAARLYINRQGLTKGKKNKGKSAKAARAGRPRREPRRPARAQDRGESQGQDEFRSSHPTGVGPGVDPSGGPLVLRS